jgi:pyridoxine 4-dehydrogenase
MQEPTSARASNAGTLTLGEELRVHRMGFGAMRLCGPGVWGWPADREGALTVLRRAVELGVTFIDTAEAYGPGVNEEQIFQALHPYPEDLVVATKGGTTRSGPGQWGRDGRPERLKRSCEESLRRLGLDRIDLYQLHAVDRNVPFEEQIGALRELRDSGKIRLAGLSNVTLDQLQRAEAIVPIASVQNEYNVGTRISDPIVEYCERRGIAFISYFPLDGGDIDAIRALDPIARAHEATVWQVALAWLLARSSTMLVIPGTSSMQHLEENVAASSLRLSDDELAALDRVGR